MKLSKALIVLFLASTFKVYVAENYTKMYLIELEFENLVYPYMTEVLRNNSQINITNASVSEINATTDCTLRETHKSCSCTPQNTWRDDICKAYACCKNENCLIKVNDSALCLSDKRVRISGFTKWKNESDAYSILLDESKKQTDEYEKMNQEIIDELVKTFSKLLHFDSLIIDRYRSGSVFVDFTVQLLGSVTSNDLVSVAKYLNKSELTTTGLVHITVPEKQPIDLGSTATITCRPAENLGQVKWYLDVQNKTTEITAGKEASLTRDDPKDILTLTGISGSWKGTFKCEYTKDSIKHKASKQLDIALLPEITAKSTPQFPNCRDGGSILVEVECKISDNKENYTVEWNTTLEITPKIKDTEFQNNFISYKATATVLCHTKREEGYVNCIFTNNRATSNKLKMEKVEIPIINADSAFCPKDDVWPDTKSGYTAKLPCANYAVGWKTRECNNTNWQKEISSCVNVNLHVIQKDIEELNKGIGFIKDNAVEIFGRIKETTTTKTFNSYANINASVNILDTMNNVSQNQSNKWNDSVMPDFVNSVSNLLNKTEVWKNPKDDDALALSTQYVQAIEKIVQNSNLTMGGQPFKNENVELHPCDDKCRTFNASVTAGSGFVVVGFRNLNEILNSSDTSSVTSILSVTTVNNTNVSDVVLTFDYSKERLPNHEMFCVFWDEKKSNWSQEGCEWGGADNAEVCRCRHNSAFTILMSKSEVTLPYMKELTYVGLGISIVSLVLCLIIEILIWDTVVKSHISNFRHVAIFNICLCLLLAHIGFLASAEPKKLDKNWCSILTLVKHFFFLAVFFWMLCLSFVILHQIIFVFENLRKKVFIILSITVGYVCPILCVAVTYISYGNGVEGQYYNPKTCWLKYEGTLKGSIYFFILPVGTIVFINLFTLAVVIMKIVTPTVSEAKARDEKDVAKSMIKTIVFLSPVLGITWVFGFFIMDIDLTTKPLAEIINYTFTLLNSLQGFFILLTNCIGEKKIRDALQKRFKGSKQSAHSKSESSTKATTSSVMKK